MKTLLEAYNSGLIKALKCKGCPKGYLTGKPDALPDEDPDALPGATDLSDFDPQPDASRLWDGYEPCQYPEFLMGHECPI